VLVKKNRLELVAVVKKETSLGTSIFCPIVGSESKIPAIAVDPFQKILIGNTQSVYCYFSIVFTSKSRLLAELA